MVGVLFWSVRLLLLVFFFFFKQKTAYEINLLSRLEQANQIQNLFRGRSWGGVGRHREREKNDECRMPNDEGMTKSKRRRAFASYVRHLNVRPCSVIRHSCFVIIRHSAFGHSHFRLKFAIPTWIRRSFILSTSDGRVRLWICSWPRSATPTS